MTTAERDLEIVDAANRREFLALIAALGLLAACTDGDEAAEAPPAPTTRKFVDVTGNEVEVPDVARRIVATNDQNAGAQLLSLGAPVVGIASRDGVIDPTLTEYFDMTGIETVGEHFEPNLEKIAALNPDLIVHEGYDGQISVEDATLSALRAIAPVVGIDAFRPIEEFMADHARLLGPAAVAKLDQQAAEFATALEELQAVLGDRWSEVSVSLITSNEGSLEAYSMDSLGETDILSRLGATPVPLMVEAAESGEGYIANISLERLPEFSADIVLIDTSFSGKDIVDNPLYQRLPAVEADQVLEMNSSMSAAHYPGYLAFAGAVKNWLTERPDLKTDLAD